MKKILLLLIPIFSFSYNLKDYINSVSSTNLYKAKEYNTLAKEEEIKSIKGGYLPTADIGLSYNHTTPTNIPNSPHNTLAVFAKLSVTLYDGGIKRAQILSKSYEKSSLEFEKRVFLEDSSLNVVKSYFNIFKLQSLLRALEVKSKELNRQYMRLKKFYENGLATEDELFRVKASKEENIYNIENTKQMILSAKEGLKLLTNLSVKNLREVKFINPKKLSFKPNSKILSLQQKSKSLNEASRAVSATNGAKVIFSNTYSKIDYLGFEHSSNLIKHQNKLSFNISKRLYDGGVIKHKSEAIKYNKLALNSQIAHLIKQQKMNLKIAKHNLKTISSNIKSANSALVAANKSYKRVKANYENGLIDNTTYLDALSQKVMALARYKQTLYEYEIAKAVVYYYAGVNLKSKIRRK